ncbi:uncharacterized protein FA14DRAFT_153067 [Meira miltonrushii]|uniref:DNA replication regulator SLD2 n=1 Tax=Meira miltonrushii TaxID=1280837 RepID=A0A316VKV9_9BASI|nr:uncharacterized protein FA14DRAFT_153067 [Meira miltonrushii]PWN37708.1 hypothetical protein FA14DRAFT_153067 [Meira miltonrushii]
MESILAKEIKAFRKGFKKQHGRDPTRKDMAKEGDMAEKYDAWLSLKSGQKGGPSTSSHSSQKEQGSIAPTIQSRKRSLEGEKDTDEHGTMAPPPVTPKKKIHKSDFDVAGSRLFKTPTRSEAVHDHEMRESIDNSGGSVRSLIDVPTTPSRKSPSKKSMRAPTTPSSTHFDDGTSPSKLRTLIDSFAATRSRGTVTPTKKKIQGHDEDEKLASHLHSSYQTKNGNTNNHRQNGSMFTPRTKARKRLRGEVVITPGKTPQKSTIGKQQVTPTKTIRPSKRQRGMGTLKDYGIVPIAGPQAKMNAAAMMKMKGANQLRSDEEEDEDDDLIGPSPSRQRIVNVQVQSSFRPLFDNAEHPSADLDDEDDAGMEELQSSPTGLTQSTHAADTALTTPAEEDPEAEMDSDEEERMYLREYTRRYHPYDHNRHSITQSGNKENLDDVIDEEEDGMLVGIGLPTLRTEQVRDESDEENLFENLSIHSPQGKKARQQQRRQNARDLRNLLQADKIFDKAAALASKGANDESEDEGDEKAESGAASKQAGGKNDQKPLSSLKTARMMRGKVTKAQRRALAAAEAMEEVEKELAVKGDAAPRAPRKKGKKSMILRRGRDDESEEDDDVEHNIDDDHLTASAHAQEDDEWASDVDSAEYGLGDGYMDEMDVM